MGIPNKEGGSGVPRLKGKFDLEVVGRLACVTAPKQARSERSLQRVLAALEYLLEEKAFAEISIPEIAATAECSAAAIYGRFKDRHSILAALHESLCGQMRGELDQLTEPQQWAGRSLEHLAAEFCAKLVAFYRRDWNLMTAAVVSGDSAVYQRAVKNIHHACGRFVVAAHATELPRGEAISEDRVEMGIRAVFALLQQRLLLGIGSFPTSAQSDLAFASELALVLRKSLRI